VSYPSKLDLFLDVNMPRLEELIAQLGKDIGLRDKRQIKGLRLLLCNLYIQGDRQIFVSRRKQSLGTKKYNPLDIGYRSIISSVDALDEAGYILQKKGSYDEGKQTTIEPTDNLREWFRWTGWSDAAIDKRVGTYITLREKEKVKDKPIYIDFEDTDYSRWLSNEIKQYDKLLNNTEIVLNSVHGIPERTFKRFTVQRKFISHSFKDLVDGEFAFGGRIPGPWSNLASEDRARITFNGEATIELDRTASHINAMYQVITDTPYDDGDPYHLIVDGHLVPRQIVKNFSSFMQGSKSPRGAVQSVVKSYKRKIKKSKESNGLAVKNYDEYLEFKKKVPPLTIINVFLDKHPKVRGYYNRDKAWGDYISCWESDIVFEVVMELTKRGIPCLTVYDSFIVPLKHKEYVDSIKDITPYVNRRGSNFRVI